MFVTFDDYFLIIPRWTILGYITNFDENIPTRILIMVIRYVYMYVNIHIYAYDVTSLLYRCYFKLIQKRCPLKIS